jgi:Xaa-Pro aminopeptidase
MDYAARRRRLGSELEAADLDALLVTRLTNIRYLSGFTGSMAFLLLSPKPVLVVDFRYRKQATQETAQVEVVAVTSSREVWPRTRHLLADSGWRRIGIEADDLSLARFLDLSEKAQAIEWVPTNSLVERLRYRKDADEVRALREAVRIADETAEEILQVLRPGMTEHRVAGEIERLQRSKGGERSASEIIVASGPRSCLPHGIASSRVIQSGEPVMMDLGTVVDGYLSDLTRTVHLGPADNPFRRIYDAVFEAQRRAEAQIGPGLTGRQADAIARDYLSGAGFGDYFGHALGHSIGLDNHERPGLSPFDDTVLEPGMVTTVEPGVYLPDVGGVRLEDMVLITERGCDVLSQSRKTLIEL